MVEHLINILVTFVTHVIDLFSYPGIVALMAAESANIPIPSEAIMPFAGFLVAQGQLNLFEVALAGAFGNWLGSAFSWWIGATYGKSFVQKFGKYVLLRQHHLDQAERWFAKYGEISVLIGRLLPVVRTFISLPAGFAKMNFLKFSLYTIAGSLPFCYLLAYLGFRLAERWEVIRQYFHYLDAVVVIGLMIVLFIMISRRRKAV